MKSSDLRNERLPMTNEEKACLVVVDPIQPPPEIEPVSATPKLSLKDRELRFSEEWMILEEKSQEEKIAIGDIITLLNQRSYTFLLLLLSLPFIQPIPFPGLSTPFGLVIALIGVGFLLGHKPWLPDRLLKIELPKTFLAVALQVMHRLVGILEVVLRPRIVSLLANRSIQRLQGFCILGSGLLLCLPLPIPFTNMLPAVTVILFSCATLGKDGFFYLGGIFCFGITLAFFALLGFGGSAVMAWISEWLAENVFAE
jgi:hypothetical protein